MPKNKTTDNSWVSLSDMMTGLMVIFLFISVSYIVEVQKQQKKRDIIFEEFKDTKEKLYAELDSAFKDDFKQWQVVLDKDLSIKFTNPEVLFESGQAAIRPNFATILNDFLPRYINILLKPDYQNRIAEIRIEGHTDAVPAPQFDKDPYIGNIKLSQLRSAEVLKYFRNMQYYQELTAKDEQQLQFWLTANGLSYGRTLDSDKQLTAESGNPINNANSRRVEFRIITTSENLVEQVLKEMAE
ncbi:MAG: OmpA family protein [Candidatus Symbiothrix sp.]|jgi:flagellar motor protein MotB|nr:OmpA family protein [Candidatus Symbiothrix sp.]